MKQDEIIFTGLLYLGFFIGLMINGWRPTKEKMTRGILAMHCSWIAAVMTVVVLVVRYYIS